MAPKAATGTKKEYNIPSALRLEAEARVPISVQKLFTHKFSHTDSNIGVIEEHSMVMVRDPNKVSRWDVNRIGTTHRLDGTSNIEPENETVLSGVDCLDAMAYLSGFERTQAERGASSTEQFLNHYISAAKEAGIIFDLEGKPHPLVDGCIVTEGAFPTDKLREEGILMTGDSDAEPLRDIMGQETDAPRYDFILTRKQLLGNLQILLPQLTAMRDRFDETIKGDFSPSSKDAFKRSAQSCRDSVEKRLLGYPSDRQTLMNYIGSLELLVNLMETKQLFLSLDKESGEPLLKAVEQVRRRVESQQQNMDDLGYTKPQQKKMLAYIVSNDKMAYPHSVNTVLQQFADACDALKKSCQISDHLAVRPPKLKIG